MLKKTLQEIDYRIEKYRDGQNPEDYVDVIAGMREIRRIILSQMKRGNWIPVEDRLPETDDYILLSFENYRVPLVGRYEKDSEGGGKFYVGDDVESCISADLYVNAWMPLPKPYEDV